MLLVDVPSLLERLGLVAKRKGREWWACCPLHEERTPSWQMRDDPEDDERHARWRCLACHEGGSAVGLVMRVLHFERARDALEWIRSGSATAAETKAERAVREGRGLQLGPAPKPRLRFRLPPTVRFAPLPEWPTAARAYLEQRGVTAEQVERWGLGYAVDGRLAGRVVMPWRDRQGRAGGYTARSYLPTEAAAKKYLEPDARENAEVGWVYGEELWPEPHLRRDRLLVVVEGGFDGLAVERSTPHAWGAARGSNLLPGHVLRFSTWGEVVVLGDPDAAGRRFVEATRQALARHRRVRVGPLPAGYDPAKLERRRGPAALARAVEEAA